MPGDVVDVHTHFFPADIPDLAFTTGDHRWPSLLVDEGGQARIMRGSEVFRPVSKTCWDAPSRLEEMDASGVGVQVLSPVPVLLTTWADSTAASAFARAQNDALAAAASVAPTRFLWMGTVPLQDTDAAIVEMERARGLGMSGIEIGTEVHGRELDHPSLRPFFTAADQLGVALFVHPTDNTGAIRRKSQPYEFGLGMLTDTAMAAGALVFGGVLEDCPGLRVGLAHGCGSLAWAFPRMVRGASLGSAPEEFDRRMTRASELVKLLWADTLVFDPQHLGLLAARFGADHLFLGSDFPFYPPNWGQPSAVIDDAVGLGGCSREEATAIKGANGLRFLGIDSTSAPVG